MNYHQLPFDNFQRKNGCQSEKLIVAKVATKPKFLIFKKKVFFVLATVLVTILNPIA